MILMDTDILSLLLAGNPKVAARLNQAEDDVAITVITKVQILRGRHDFLLKASNGDERSKPKSRRGSPITSNWCACAMNACGSSAIQQICLQILG